MTTTLIPQIESKKLSTLLEAVDAKLRCLSRLALEQVVINGITLDSRAVKTGYVFVAQQGYTVNGNDYVLAAVEKGAVAVVTANDALNAEVKKQLQDRNVVLLESESPSIAAGELAKAFYYVNSESGQALKIIGVTGTNGKSSVCHFVAQALHLLGKKAGVLGTLGNGFVDDLEYAELTTPNVIDVHKKIAALQQQGAEYLAMEVSSHSLDQARIAGVGFDVVVFTNLSQDHLDYHGDMASYGQAKEKLFQISGVSKAVINSADGFGSSLLESYKDNMQVVSVDALLSDVLKDEDKKQADLNAVTVNSQLSGLTISFIYQHNNFDLKNEKIIGKFNAENIMLCCGVLLQLGFELDAAVEVLNQVGPVDGRLQKVSLAADELAQADKENSQLPLVLVDFAHTPDALLKLLQTSKDLIDDGRLVLVFGCGGDRDQAKRAQMAKAVEGNCDRVIVTTDNSRDEKQQDISKDILKGFDHPEVVELIEDRQQAIYSAIEKANEKDLVVIAGKGHEKYQLINGERIAFDDVVVARSALSARVGLGGRC